METPRIDIYLDQCRVLALTESETTVPPSPAETRVLVKYLFKMGLAPVIVGSVAVVHYLTGPVKASRRPTKDLDMYVRTLPGAPPPGWKRDESSIGVTSWISPSGGYVDFLVAGDILATGDKIPSKVKLGPTSDRGYPVIDVFDLIKMKISTQRGDDVMDAVRLVRSMGRIPDVKELGHLTREQQENWEYVRIWAEKEMAVAK